MASSMHDVAESLSQELLKICIDDDNDASKLMAELLKSQFIIPHPPTVTDMFGPEFEPKRFVGRDKQIRDLWKVIDDDEHLMSKCPSYYFHASPGMGKTFLFRYLASKESVPKEFRSCASETVFFAVDFNRSSCANIVEKAPFLQRTTRTFLPLMRLFYVHFVDQHKLKWEDFLGDIVERVGNREFADRYVVGAILSIIRRKYAGRKRVLLVDELSKAGCLWRSAPDEFRSALCSLCDGSDPAFKCVIFSSLSRELMTSEYTSSNRPMVPVVVMPLLTMDESVQYLDENINCVFKDSRRLERDRAQVIKSLAVVGGGHPRSLLYIVQRCNAVKDELQIEINEIITSAGYTLRSAYKLPSFFLKLLHASLLAQPVRLGDTVSGDDPGDVETYESLINRGILLESLSGDAETAVPRIPEIFLHSWCRSDLDMYSDIKVCLQKFLQMRCGFSAKQYESIYGSWECLRRLLRNEEWSKRSNRGKVTCDVQPLISCYRVLNTMAASKTEVLQVPVDCSTPLESVSYSSSSDLILEPNTIVYPSSDSQPGWDSIIVLEAFPHKNFFHRTTRYLLPLFIQNKWSKESSSTKADDEDVVTCVHHCMDFIRTCKVSPGFSLLTNYKWSFRKFPLVSSIDTFVVMFVANREHTKGALENAPGNAVTLFREHLLGLYGPTISAYLETLEPETIICACG
jgi:hypothetical protein